MTSTWKRSEVQRANGTAEDGARPHHYTYGQRVGGCGRDPPVWAVVKAQAVEALRLGPDHHAELLTGQQGGD